VARGALIRRRLFGGVEGGVEAATLPSITINIGIVRAQRSNTVDGDKFAPSKDAWKVSTTDHGNIRDLAMSLSNRRLTANCSQQLHFTGKDWFRGY